MNRDEVLDKHIDDAESELKSLKRLRKKRSDDGIKRGPNVNSNIPSNYRRYINKANKSSRSFTLSEEQFNELTSKECIYCGSNEGIGIDRIHPNIGYEYDNCQPCCFVCNMMKNKSSKQGFLEHISKIFSRHFLQTPQRVETTSVDK